jgi:predicted nucleic acid-binding protein
MIRPHAVVGGRDAHLAALAIEHRAAVASSDADCRRFPRIEHVKPLEAAPE